MAVETESGGVFSVVDRDVNPLPVFTIRGISDYSDENKTKLEHATSDQIRRVAAKNAARFLKISFQNPHFLKYLLDRKNGKSNVGDAPETKSVDSFLDEAFQYIADEVHMALCDLSSEYRAQPKGYLLPAPRLRPIRAAQRSQNVEASNIALSTTPILVGIPRSYPDDSFPWILADHLLRAETEETRILPYVVDLEEIRLPKKTANETAKIVPNWERIATVPGVRRCIIVKNFSYDNERKVEFLFQNLGSDTTTFLIGRRDRPMLFDRIPYKFTAYEVGEISFASITDFVQKNFSKTESEAEVIAFKLSNLFTSFDLLIHPTYFAEVGEGNLAKLLNANSRAELLQLAVDGFLMFVVAADETVVSLHRSTRKRFLTELVVRQEFEKVYENREELIERARLEASKYDFEIDPEYFIQQFIDKGILSVGVDKIEFSLSFMKHYLLAEYLARNSNKARTYFDLDDEKFDASTFEIFCELSDDTSIADELLSRLRDEATKVRAKRSSINSILASPNTEWLFSNAMKQELFASRLGRKIVSLREDKDRRKEKTELLDAIHDVGQSARAGKVQAIESGERTDLRVNPNGEPKASGLLLTGRLWALGAIMLGRAAENLQADCKRGLASVLIEMLRDQADIELDERTRIDFEGDINAFFGSEPYRDFISGIENEHDKKEIDILLRAFFDSARTAYLIEPIFSAIQFLCEETGRTVLCKSIEACETNDRVEALLRAVWMLDIDGKRGAPEVKKALKQATKAPLLRSSLALHLLERVFWAHSDRSQRDLMLDAADELLRPMGPGLMNRKQIENWIEKNDEN